MGHYFDDDVTAPSSPRPVTWMLPDGPLTLVTDRGVFGYDTVDAGTKLLLLKAQAPDSAGHMLDLGCGTGAIALTLARRCPRATVWAVDVNPRARLLCKANAEANHLTNVRIAAPDEVPDDITFTTVWSNPPIRIGKTALHELLQRWLARLSPTGDAWLTVQKHLGADSLQRWLTEHGYPTVRVASAAGFRILHLRASTTSGVDLDAQP
jgi:16S rRNA (guanine1207-N2)-methyltransferase